MKTKFTLLIMGCMFIAASTKAQDGGYRNDNRNDEYRDYHNRDNRFDYQNYYDLRNQLYGLQQRLMHEMDELDRARDCRDWDKVDHERQEIAQIKYQMWQINQRMRYRDFDDDHRDHDHDRRY
jgi:hypothetical protein